MEKKIVLKAVTWIICKTIGIITGYLLTCGWVKIATLIIGSQFSWSTAAIIYIVYTIIKVVTGVITRMTK